MKGKIIGIVLCSIAIIGIIILLICNWTGAFAQSAEAQTRTLSNNGIMVSEFIPSLYYTFGGDSTTSPWVIKPRFRNISLLPYKDNTTGWGIHFVIQNSYDPTIAGNTYSFDWDIEGQLIETQIIGSNNYWIYTGYPGGAYEMSTIITSASNVPNQDIFALETWLNAAENLAIYYIDYHYTGYSIQWDICFVDISIDDGGLADLSNTKVFSINLHFGVESRRTSPKTYYTLGGSVATTDVQNIKIKPNTTINYPMTTPAYYNNDGSWNTAVIFREINTEMDYYIESLQKAKTYNEGYNDGYNIGKNEGYEQGKTDGIEQGISSSTPIQSATSLVKSVLSAFDIKLFGVFSVLDLIGIVVVLGLVLLVIKLIR